MSTETLLRLSPTNIDALMSTLDVSLVKLSECLVRPQWRLVLAGANAAAPHYNLKGTGRLIIADHPPIDLVTVIDPKLMWRRERCRPGRRKAGLRSREPQSRLFAAEDLQ